MLTYRCKRVWNRDIRRRQESGRELQNGERERERERDSQRIKGSFCPG